MSVQKRKKNVQDTVGAAYFSHTLRRMRIRMRRCGIFNINAKYTH